MYIKNLEVSLIILVKRNFLVQEKLSCNKLVLKSPPKEAFKSWNYKRIYNTHLNLARNFCFIAAIDRSLHGLNAFIAIIRTLGLQAAHLIQRRSN